MIPVGILTAAATSSYVGLLDTYPGAAAAYSLRKLRNAYTGSAIRVRRSSDNAETNIGFISDGSLNTTALLTFVGSSNGAVSIWYDQSGNSNNATQTSNVDQFLIVLSGSLITKNTKPSLIIDFTDTMNLSFNISGSAGTLFEVTSVEQDPPTFTNGSLLGYITASPEASHQPFTDGNIYENFASTVRKNSGNPVFNLTNLYLYNVLSETNLYNVKINNATLFNTTTNVVGFGANVPKIASSNSVSFGSFQYRGYASEIIIYNNSQNSNISGINANINSFYTIY